MVDKEMLFLQNLGNPPIPNRSELNPEILILLGGSVTTELHQIVIMSFNLNKNNNKINKSEWLRIQL